MAIQLVDEVSCLLWHFPLANIQSTKRMLYFLRVNSIVQVEVPKRAGYISQALIARYKP